MAFWRFETLVVWKHTALEASIACTAINSAVASSLKEVNGQL